MTYSACRTQYIYCNDALKVLQLVKLLTYINISLITIHTFETFNNLLLLVYHSASIMFKYILIFDRLCNNLPTYLPSHSGNYTLPYLTPSPPITSPDSTTPSGELRHISGINNNNPTPGSDSQHRIWSLADVAARYPLTHDPMAPSDMVDNGPMGGTYCGLAPPPLAPGQQQHLAPPPLHLPLQHTNGYQACTSLATPLPPSGTSWYSSPSHVGSAMGGASSIAYQTPTYAAHPMGYGQLTAMGATGQVPGVTGTYGNISTPPRHAIGVMG